MANRQKDATDWNAVDAINDNDIAKAVAGDPDAAPLDAKGLKLVRMGRPRSANPKQSTTLRLPADVLIYFKAGGKGWQTRISDALSEYVAEHGREKGDHC
jgi:uncharacterized protein (DUF4415 family)